MTKTSVAGPFYYVACRDSQVRGPDGNMVFATAGGGAGVEMATIIRTVTPVPESWTGGKVKAGGVRNAPRWRVATPEEVRTQKHRAVPVLEEKVTNAVHA